MGDAIRQIPRCYRCRIPNVSPPVDTVLADVDNRGVLEIDSTRGIDTAIVCSACIPTMPTLAAVAVEHVNLGRVVESNATTFMGDTR